jgi:hypothetical protein
VSKPIREGSFEHLILNTTPTPGRGRMTMEEVTDSIPVRDRTADQFGVKAVGSIAELEEERIPWLRRCRRALRALRPS